MLEGEQPPVDPHAELVRDFQQRIAERDVMQLPDAPETDEDIIEQARLQGLSDEEITAANLLARQRISAHRGLPLVDRDATAIAQDGIRRLRRNNSQN